MANDILNTISSELRANPWKAPEGYFLSLKGNLRRPEIRTAHKKTIWMKPATYISFAASIAIIALSTIVFRSHTSQEGMSYEDYIVLSGGISSEYYTEDIPTSENGMNEEDIIEYLIYSGITAEVIELSK